MAFPLSMALAVVIFFQLGQQRTVGLPDTQSLMSVPDLEAAMYVDLSGDACVRVLSADGEHGCSNPSRSLVSAPIQRVENAVKAELKGKRTVLISAQEFAGFLERTVLEPNLAAQVAGVLVEFDHEDGNGTHIVSSFSPVDPFPQSQFSPYVAKGGGGEGPGAKYVWNPPGNGLAGRRWPFPVFALSEASTLAARERARINAEKDFRHPLHVVELSAVMLTSKLETRNSSACLASTACLPLGGFSVWTAFPPLLPAGRAGLVPPKPIILVVASMDAKSFFRDLAPGADSALSGLIALLAAVDALSSSAAAGTLTMTKQLVFAVFTGEQWGYLGSRQFLRELAGGGPNVAGLDPKLVEAVVEIGPVGRAGLSSTGAAKQFYVHPAPSVGSGELVSAFKKVSAAGFSVVSASSSNPGIPPTSLTAFVRSNASIPGLVLTEFDTQFVDPFYMSRYDDRNNISPASIAAAATIASRAIHALAGGSPRDAARISANATLVADMADCLLTQSPGMWCPLVADLLTAVQPRASHYVGVFQADPRDEPSTYYIDVTAQFVWNFLATRTDAAKLPTQQLEGMVSGGGRVQLSVAEDANRTACSGTCAGEGEVCVRLLQKQKGICIRSTTRYVPAYSPRLYYDDKGWHVRVLTPADQNSMDSDDPLWTESFWDTLGLRVYLQDSPSRDALALIFGLLVTSLSSLAIFSTRAFFHRHIKNA